MDLANSRIFPFLPYSRDAVLYMYISVFNTSNTDINLEFLRIAFLTNSENPHVRDRNPGSEKQRDR